MPDLHDNPGENRGEDLGEDLRDLDACLARVPVPAGLEGRIVAATTLQQIQPSSGRSLGLALAFAAGVLLAMLALRERPAPPRPATSVSETAIDVPSPTPLAPVPEQDTSEQQPASGLTILSERCTWSHAGERLQFAAGCRMRLAEPSMDLEIWAPTQLELHATGVTVRDGVALFFVDPVADPRTPARVGVSGGTIEIVGTRFVVSQARARGHVDLIEGAIRFRRLDGELDDVEAGRRYAWRSPATKADVPPELPSPTEQAATSLTDSLAEGLAEVARLRRAGELGAAIAKLDALAREQDDTRTLEVISYERGTLVERSAGADAACQFWLEHRRTYPSGRYEREVDGRLTQLDCAPR